MRTRAVADPNIIDRHSKPILSLSRARLPLHVQNGVAPAVGRGIDTDERLGPDERLQVLPVLPVVDGCFGVYEFVGGGFGLDGGGRCQLVHDNMCCMRLDGVCGLDRIKTQNPPVRQNARTGPVVEEAAALLEDAGDARLHVVPQKFEGRDGALDPGHLFVWIVGGGK